MPAARSARRAGPQRCVFLALARSVICPRTRLVLAGGGVGRRDVDEHLGAALRVECPAEVPLRAPAQLEAHHLPAADGLLGGEGVQRARPRAFLPRVVRMLPKACGARPARSAP